MRDGAVEPLQAPVMCVVGARPNFMKMAPILRAFEAAVPRIPALLVHTGQHYDTAMNDQLFAGLRLPSPDVNLEVGSGTHAVQTAEVMRRFEPLLDEHSPSCVLVVGDVNSTLACSLVAAKGNVPVAHVEAGLRSFDRTMPEEINRVLTDQISDRLYTSERSAHANLEREGVAPERICFVGNVMIDTLLANRTHAIPASRTLQRAGLDVDARGYGVVTLHRPSNVDDPSVLQSLLSTLMKIAAQVPLAFPVHPRTDAAIERLNMRETLDRAHVALLPPQGYLEMLGLMADARLVLTDSGGIQEETTALGVPCLTVRDNTERPITVECGTNVVVGRNHQSILCAVDEIVATGGKRGRIPEGWDGHAADRIARDLARFLAQSESLEVTA